MRYLYNSKLIDEEQKDVIGELAEAGVEIEDTAEWDDSEREEVYKSELLPRSVQNSKKLRGKIRSHQAGKVSFGQGVLITKGNFYIGNKIQQNLNLILSTESLS